MAEQEHINTIWVEEIFAQNKSVIFHKMQEIVTKKKCVLELKSKICTCKEQKNKLKEYNKLLENIKHKSNELEVIIPNLTNAIENIENSIINVKKDIAVLESQRKVEITPDKKIVTSMKKMLSELYNNNFDSLIQKENKLHELQKRIKEYNVSYIFKEKKDLDEHIKEYDFLKAKNLRLKEMISMNIEQKI